MLSEILVVTNAFVHDLSTGVWFGAVILLNLLSAKLPREHPYLSVGRGISATFQIYAIVAFIIMILTGVARAAFFHYYGWTGDVAASRSQLLLIKHVVLGAAVLSGIYLQVRAFLYWRAV
jgi:putative copper export protein